MKLMQLPVPHFVPLAEALKVLQGAHTGAAVVFSTNQIVSISQIHSLLGGEF